MLIDFHTHLDHYPDSELDKTIASIKQNKIVCVASSCNLISWKKNKEIADKLPDLIIPTFGIHPSYIDETLQKLSQAHLSEVLEKHLTQSSIVGEIGLDYFWEKTIPHNIQKTVFSTIMDHCNRYRKVCVIHTKGAEKEIQTILKNYPDAKPVIHWYDGPESVFNKLINSGYSFTFGCEVLYSKKIQKFLKLTPVELLLSETDNPTGEPWLGGKDNSPMLIKRVVNDIARIKGLDFDEVEAIIEKNSRKLLENCLFN